MEAVEALHYWPGGHFFVARWPFFRAGKEAPYFLLALFWKQAKLYRPHRCLRAV